MPDAEKRVVRTPGMSARRAAVWGGHLAAVLIASLLAVVSSPARAAPETPADLPTIKLQLRWFHQAQFVGFYVADEQGYYEREGIRVELLPGGVGPDGTTVDSIRSLMDGTADLAIAWLGEALLERRAGGDVTHIAQIFRKPATTLLCRRDAGIGSLRDLRGQQIGVWNIGDQYNVAYWLRLNNLAVKDVTLVEQRPDGLDLLESKFGCVTAMTYNEYWTILSAGVLPSNLVITRSEGFLEDGIYARAAAIADPVKADRMARFLRASAHGWRYAAQNFDEALALTLAKAPGTNAQHQRRMLETVLGLAKTPNSFGLLDLAAYDRSVDIVGHGVADHAGIERAARRGWTHDIWYKAGLSAERNDVVRASVRHRLAMFVDSWWFYLLDLVGTVAFGVAGFMRAHQRRYDLWGAFVLTMLPAVGGGTLRDLLISGDRHPPFIFKDPTYITIVIGIVLLGTLLARMASQGAARSASQGAARSASFSRALTVFDTVGVTAFTVVGAKVALMAEVAWFWVPICAALTCAGGGMLLDIVTGREPRTFQGEPYEEIAIGGGLFILAGLLVAGHFEHAAWIIPATLIAAMVGVFVVRLLVVRYGWRSYRLAGERSLVSVPPRAPGRSFKRRVPSVRTAQRSS
jgi:NitT/TauT family transport system substrate-binding protein